MSAQTAGYNFYVAPNGTATNDGSVSRPLDLATALSASSPARPGDTIWLRGGTYTGNFVSFLNGAGGAPITVRQYPGERATLDAANGSQAPTLSVKGSYAWFWGFEVMNSYPNRTSGASSRGPGIMQYGPYTKLINLVVHDALDGIGTWSGVTDGEIYGNVIYNNGADSGGVGAGHSIYVQNSTGTKRIVDNVMSNSYNFGIHVYTENGTINNVSMDGNIAFNHGVLATSSSYKANYFVGGSQVAQSPELTGNYGYYPWGSQGRNADLGWGTACNSLMMFNNYLAGGTSAKINCTNSTVAGNWLYGDIASSVVAAYGNNTFSATRPAGVLSVVRPNQYETGRANIAIYNWSLLSSVAVDLSASGLKSGDGFEIRNAQNFFGPAVLTGTYNGSAVTIPMVGLVAAAPIGAAVRAPATGPEFNAFVVLPTGAPSPPSAPTATFSASPTSVTAGQSAILTWTTTGATSVSITPTVGTVATSGSVAVTPTQTTTYTLTATGAGGSASKTINVAVTSGTGGAQSSATFVRTDTTTQGAWASAYGNDGFQVAGDTTQYPGYAQVTVGGAAAWTWLASTSDARALQKSSGSGRIAATWYGSTAGPITIDVTFTDGARHQIALYALDWDGQSRGETIQIADRATGALLDQRSASAFTGGSYLVWQVTGSVRISVTRTSGANAVFSGLFFGGARASTPPPNATATFVKTDQTTQGSWVGRYGVDGVALAGNATQIPSYARVTFAGSASWTWAASTADIRAPQKVGAADRVAATWYDTSGAYTIDVTITDGAAHRFAMYLLDWDRQLRGETIQLTDAVTGAVLDQRTLSGFEAGTYVVWQISGAVRVRITRSQGLNAVVSGLFFN
jgi:hypothetical protein